MKNDIPIQFLDPTRRCWPAIVAHCADNPGEWFSVGRYKSGITNIAWIESRGVLARQVEPCSLEIEVCVPDLQSWLDGWFSDYDQMIRSYPSFKIEKSVWNKAALAEKLRKLKEKYEAEKFSWAKHFED